MRRSSIARGSLVVTAISLVLAACGGGGGTTGQAASQAPSSAASATPTISADPLEGDWRNESTCQDALRALRRRLSDEKVLEAAGAAGWNEFLFPWGGEPTDDDPCHGATGTRAFVARFAEGNLALCDAKTGDCEVHATYELVGDHAITLTDPEENLCPCPAPWTFEIVGDRLTIHVEPADPWTVSTWEAAPWTRES